jgi:hypothetical protein
MKSHVHRSVVLFGVLNSWLAASGCSDNADIQPSLPDAAVADTLEQRAPPVQDTARGEITAELWQQAAASIRHLPLDSFPELPVAVRQALVHEQCQIPQAFHPETPHNIIRGEFAASGQVDWAALCTSGESARIFVIWGGPIRCPTPIASELNRAYLQGIGGWRIRYSRGLDVASMEYILEHATAYDGPDPPSRDHAGINDAFVEKASVIHYCHEGKWYLLAGAD